MLEQDGVSGAGKAGESWKAGAKEGAKEAAKEGGGKAKDGHGGGKAGKPKAQEHAKLNGHPGSNGAKVQR